MAYNFKKKTCDKCGITQAAANKKPPLDTGIDHPLYRYTTSHRLGADGSVLCAWCHREKELEDLFAAMDRAEERAKHSPTNQKGTHHDTHR